jgi:hypothetical protein
MEEHGFISKQVEVVLKTYCNACGFEIVHNVHSDRDSHRAQIFATWGYGSPKDGQDHLAHLCEKCYDTMIVSWVIAPTITGLFNE